MELFRALAVLAEPPNEKFESLAIALRLGDVPDEAEYTELFLLQLYPYASVYLGNEGMLGGEARDRIAGFWRAIGLTPPEEPDHLAVMLAMYAQLIEHEEQASSTKAREAWQRTRSTFLWEHLLSWLPFYLDKVELMTTSSFYSHWASILRAALLREAQAFHDSMRPSIHHVDVKPISDPRQDGADAFLDSLLAPARCGFILARKDISNTANQSGFGSRIGDRKFMLKALLEQGAPATLLGLASTATDWAKQPEQRHQLLGPIAAHWSSRATESGVLLRELAFEANP
jgi:TorA maturation chaperone TorD